VAYIPANNRVCGLSKIARTVDVFARRLQMQERLTAQIADALVEHLEPQGVAVILEGEHMCMRMRGASKSDADMLTTAFRGLFDEDAAARAEVVALLTARGERR
jgi:GTP cyclohydrolase I